MNALGIALAVAAAAAFAGCSLLQHGAAQRVEVGRLGLLVALLRDRVWLLGTVLDGVAIALQATALRFAALAVVQPVLVSGLVLVVAFNAVARRQPPAGRDIAGAAACSAGLAGFLAVSPPSAGNDSVSPAAVVALVTTTAVIALAGALLRGRSPRKALVLAGGCGVVYAIGAAALKVTVDRIADPLALLQSWTPYLLVGSGLVGVWLNQRAFRAGELFGPLALMSVAEPVVAAVIGVAALHERLPDGAMSSPAPYACGLAMVIGIVLLARPRGPRLSAPGPTPASATATLSRRP